MPEKLKRTVVTTISGEKVSRKRCRKIRGKFYKIGNVNIQDSGDCYRLTSETGVTKYYTVEKGRVFWDDNQQKYIYAKNLVKGIISGRRKMGGIKKSPSNVEVVMNSGEKVLCLNRETAINAGFTEDLITGLFFDTEYDRKELSRKRNVDRDYKYSLPYGCGRLIKPATKKFNELFKPKKSKFSLAANLYKANPGLFDKYTFGLEFETTRGIIPQDICDRLGLIPLRDGSISGIEYVTIPLQGEKGLYALEEIWRELEYRTEFDYSCSMHVHVGGIKRTATDVMALYKMMTMVQEDVYEYFPPYKKKNNGMKRQDYTAPLPKNLSMKMNYANKTKASIKEDMSQLIYHMSGHYGGYENLNLEDVEYHPYDRSNDRKWNMTARYLWFNIIPIVFTNKQTVEYRIFSMPTNATKLFFFLSMALSLVEFTENHKDAILSDPDRFYGMRLRNVFREVLRGSEKIRSYAMNRKSQVVGLFKKKGYQFVEKDIM